MTVKECRVVSTNACNTVVVYDGVGEIQLPTPNVSGDCVHVKKENERYSICTKEEYENFIDKTATVSAPIEKAFNNADADLEFGIVDDKRIKKSKIK